MPAPCARAACAPLPCPAMASFPHPTDMPLWYRKSWCEPSCRLYFFARRQRGFALVGRQLFALPFVCFAQCSPRLLYFLPAACYTAGKLTGFLAGRRCSLVRFAETTFAPQGDGNIIHHITASKRYHEKQLLPRKGTAVSHLFNSDFRQTTFCTAIKKPDGAFLLRKAPSGFFVPLYVCFMAMRQFARCLFNSPAFSALSLP